MPPQTPLVLPGGMAQGVPLQQSAFEVHAPAVGTQSAWHRLLTHGLPQQSPLVTQLVPGGIGVPVQSSAFSAQRGMPSASLRQQFSG